MPSELTSRTRPQRLCIAITLLLLPTSFSSPVLAATPTAEHVLWITFDGLRWQEFFGGVDMRLVNSESGGVKDVDAVRQTFERADGAAARAVLLPFIWNEVVPNGQVFGAQSHGSLATCTNGRFFSYPGYSEILCGFPDDRIDSNDKIPNPNSTVLEWLHGKPEFGGKIHAWTSWDVFPFILNEQRSGIPVNAGWMPLAQQFDSAHFRQLDSIASELPHMWPSVRYDFFTFEGAKECLKRHQPRVLYVSFGETDDWAHEGRYDLYLESARRTDEYIRQLWETAQAIPEFRDKTTLIVTTDHGRGDGRESWKSHSSDIPGSEQIWIAAYGAGVRTAGIRRDVAVTQSQVAATVAELLGHDYASTDERIGDVLPGLLSTASARETNQ